MDDADIQSSHRMPSLAILLVPALIAMLALASRLLAEREALSIDWRIVPAVGAFVAAIFAITAALPGGSARRQPWLLLAVSCLGWAFWHAVGFGALDHADLLLNAGYVCFTISTAAGVLMLSRFATGRRVRLTLMLDTLPPAIALGVTVWILSVGAYVLQADVSSALRISAMIHGIGSVTLLVLGMAGVLSQRREPTDLPHRLLLAAITVLAVADAIWLHRLTGSAERSPLSTGLAFGAGYVMMAGAAGAAIVNRRQTSAFSRAGTRIGWESQVPDVALAGLLLLAGGQALFGETVRYGIATTTTAALTMLAVIVTRQSIVLRRDRHLREEIGELSTQIDGLISQVGRDPLTGLLNHRAIHERIDHELAYGRVNGEPVAVALIDVDNFKSINDTLGHQAGDRVLRAVASILTAACRGTDVAARYAGDEFMLLLPGLNESHAGGVCTRIAHEVRRINSDLRLGHGARVSLSVGVAVTHGCRRTVAQTVAIADAAMYDAKEGGKDRVVVVNADTLVISDAQSAVRPADQLMAESHGQHWVEQDRWIG